MFGGKKTLILLALVAFLYTVSSLPLPDDEEIDEIEEVEEIEDADDGAVKVVPSQGLEVVQGLTGLTGLQGLGAIQTFGPFQAVMGAARPVIEYAVPMFQMAGPLALRAAGTAGRVAVGVIQTKAGILSNIAPGTVIGNGAAFVKDAVTNLSNNAEVKK